MNFLRFRYRHIPKLIFGVLLMLLLVCLATLPLKAQQPGTEIVFSAHLQVSDQLWPLLFQSVRADLAVGDGKTRNSLVLDHNPRLVLRRDFIPGTTFDSILQVEGRGRCDLVAQGYPAFLDGPLGWVPMVSGEIGPFVSIDCTRLAQLLGRTAFEFNKVEPRHRMTQAIAHVLIHEWIHIVTQSSKHDSQGIMKASISVKGLMADPPTNVCRLESTADGFNHSIPHGR